jgi:hypothetical protein
MDTKDQANLDVQHYSDIVALRLSILEHLIELLRSDSGVSILREVTDNGTQLRTIVSSFLFLVDSIHPVRNQVVSFKQPSVSELTWPQNRSNVML